MPIQIALILAAIIAPVCTVLTMVFITPDKKRETFKSKFLIFLHDLLNFKFLILEKILKGMYILSTLFCIVFGFFCLFSGQSGYFTFRSFALQGLLYMTLGPIAVRLVYEGIMMFLLLVKNTIQINNKLQGGEREKEQPAAAEQPQAPMQ